MKIAGTHFYVWEYNKHEENRYFKTTLPVYNQHIGVNPGKTQQTNFLIELQRQTCFFGISMGTSSSRTLIIINIKKNMVKMLV